MRFTEFTPYDLVLLANGLSVSLGLFFATSLIGLLIGSCFALIRYFQFPILKQLVAAIAELLKNSPVLVQLFLVFFGLPVLLQINVTPVEAALITLSGNTAAFIYVIVVAGIEAVDINQIDAARSFGLSRWQVLTKIIRPQATAFAMGPLTGLLVNQLQVTSLVSIIGVMDLTKVGDILNFRTFKPFIVWTIIGLVYYLCSKAIVSIGARYEAKLRINGGGAVDA